MKRSNSIKQLKGAVFISSIAMGILLSFPPFRDASFSISDFLFNALFVSSLSFAIWVINLFLLHLSETYRRLRIKNNFRRLLSYILNELFLIPIVFLYFQYLGNYYKFELSEGVTFNYPKAIVFIFFLNTAINVIEASILLKNKRIMIELENAKLKQQNTEAFYNQLKQQINPHFLFNSLNILKSLIKREPDTAENYLVKLSEFLRVSIASANENTVILKEELELCTDYLEMQKVRFGKALQYSFNIPMNVQESGFAPIFSIQLLVENAIKHNSLTNEKPLKIDVTCNSGYISVSNNRQIKLTSETSTGVGLKNLSERYKILSGEDITITESEKEFCVKIKILTNENSYNRG